MPQDSYALALYDSGDGAQEFDLTRAEWISLKRFPGVSLTHHAMHVIEKPGQRLFVNVRVHRLKYLCRLELRWKIKGAAEGWLPKGFTYYTQGPSAA